MNIIIIFCAEALIFIAVAYAMLHVYFKHEKRHHIRHIAMVLGAAVLSWAASHFLKNIIAHPRPDLTFALIDPNDPYSFPSGHASFMFALAFTMYAIDRRAAWILLVLATITGISRVLVGVHYWYDIVGGAVLGLIVAVVVTALGKRFIKSA